MFLRNHIFTTLPEMFKISIKVLQSRADITIHQIMSDLKEANRMKHWLRSQMLSRKHCTLHKEEEVVVNGVEEVEEAIVEKEDVAISAPRGGVAGAAPTPTTSKTVGRRIVITTNNHEVVIRKAETAMNAEKQNTSREIVQSDEMGVEMEMEVEMEAAADSTAKAMEPVAEVEVDSTVEASEKILDQEVNGQGNGYYGQKLLENGPNNQQ